MDTNEVLSNDKYTIEVYTFFNIVLYTYNYISIHCTLFNVLQFT